MFIADFHIHSSYSRATSRECVPEILELWARRKGLALIGTGDFTHPAWREELKEKLVPSDEGLYILKKECRQKDGFPGADAAPRFIVSGEISSIYKKNGKVRKVHNLILLPGLAEAEALSLRLEEIGNLHSDGRPILGLDSRDLLEITLETCPDAIFIPAHIWTPHFSLFGAYSGFDDIKECFEDLTPYIHALETGLSSDPPMNWRLSALDAYTLVSNSDAHSPANLAREANLFDASMSYPAIVKALVKGQNGFAGTIEFFPEEGKYHYDGHRNCKACFKPAETKDLSGTCPVCGRRITVGVLHRVEDLADRAEGFVPPEAPRFESLVPLHEVIAASLGMTSASGRVKTQYGELIRTLGPELYILREAPLEEIERKAGPCVAEGIRRLRNGKVEVNPGYDGEYGKIKILDKSEIDSLSGQFSFIGRDDFKKAPKKISAPKKPADIPSEPNAESAAALPLSGDMYGLNPEQWKGASAGAPAVAVLAGPGTGKTRTLVYRIAYLVEKCGVPPEQITAVTFTNKAAAEMRERLEKHFGDKNTVRAMTIGTFHSICLKILSGWKERTSIADEYEAQSILGDILGELGIQKSTRDILQSISKFKNRTAFSKGDPDIPAAVWEMYHERLKQFHLLDYDDILLRVLERFEAGAEDLPADSFTHLLVDEFQDINEVQYRLIREWSRKSAGLFVIGDPDQSIYGFRGSDSYCFERLGTDYPGLKSIRLAQNYRSTPEILGCAIPVISAGTEMRKLHAGRNGGERVRILRAGDSFLEALFVVKEINRMVGGMDLLEAHSARGKRQSQTRGFSDIAILYRTHRQAEILEQCLQKEDIPYVVAGRDEFLMSRQVRNALSFFRFLLDPGDVFSLNECLKAADIRSAGQRQKILDDYSRKKDIKFLLEISDELSASPDYPKLKKLSGLAAQYRPAVRREKPAVLVENWIRDNGLTGDENMERLWNTALMHTGMPDFLHNLALGRETDVRRSGSRKYTPDAVSLMTLHGAKGLEFPVVFLCGAVNGLIPLTNGVRECDPDEERRLFYVGMTRAQDELVLMTSPDPSPFLADIPEEFSSTEAASAPKRRQGKQLNMFDL